MATYVEPQVGQRDDGKFWLTVTISSSGHYWTSQPAILQATTRKEALIEAARQVKLLRGYLEADGEVRHG